MSDGASASYAELVRLAVAAGKPPDKRDLERALCEIGLSNRQAKKLLARGYRGIAADDSDQLLEEIASITRKLRSV